MTELGMIALGGAFGAMARYLLGEWVASIAGDHFPWGIFLINVLGSFLIGVLFVLLVEETASASLWRPFLMVGFLGAFTTFSTFSLQTLALFEVGRWLAAASYAVGSLIFCLIAVAAGVFLSRALTGTH